MGVPSIRERKVLAEDRILHDDLTDHSDAVAQSNDVRSGHDLAGVRTIMGLRPPAANQQRMYAITFDMDTETLQQAYPGDSWRNAYVEIRRILVEEGFDWQQGSVSFGNPNRIDAVRCVTAAQRLARELPWFGESVRDVRMLRIEENNDLGPAIE
jgi:virulence-associated protein VapD